MLMAAVASTIVGALGLLGMLAWALGAHQFLRFLFFVGILGGWAVLAAGLSFYARGLNRLTGGDSSMVRLCQDLYRGLLRPTVEDIWRKHRISWRVNAVLIAAVLPFVLGQVPRLIYPTRPLPLLIAWGAVMVALIWIGIVVVIGASLWTMLAEGRWEPDASLRDAEQGNVDVFRLLFRRGFWPRVGDGTERRVPFPVEGMREALRESLWPRDPHWQRGLVLGLGLIGLAYGLFGFWLVANPPRPAWAVAALSIYAIALVLPMMSPQ
jgi:hypothetical protein